ncbi:MAG: FG-GAP-like repeat-containing protein [Gemmatimonadaceae bacterium]
MDARPSAWPSWGHSLRTAIASLAMLACSAPPVDTSWHTENGVRWRALAVPRRGQAGFTVLGASRTGLTHVNSVDVEHGLANRGLLDGAGVAIGDVNGDGRPDVVLASVEQPAALYRNDGELRFTDVTTASGLDFRGLATTSMVLADLDGDRDLDLVVGTLGGPLKCYQNDGTGHFTDITATSGLVGGFNATTMTLADIDGNGSLDLYVATYKTHNALDVYTPQQRAFDQVLKKIGDSVVVVDAWQKEFRVESRPDLGGYLRSQRAEPDLFFLNDGRGHFTRTPITGPRFRDEQGAPLTVDPDYFTLAARFYDVNGDGAPDLYACNDLEDPDLFWLNDGRGNFRLAPTTALRVTSNTCMSVDFADVNRDGHVDLFTTDMLAPTLAGQQRGIPTHTPQQKPVGLSPERTQWMRNMLQLSRGDGTWAQIGDIAGVSATDWTWGSAFLDVDLDGYDDLLAATGHRYDVREADPYDRIRNSFPRVAWNRESAEFPPLRTHNVAYRNRGDLTFQNVSDAWGFAGEAGISHGIALGDLDGDGALDVLVTRLDAPPVLYHNTTAAPRLQVQLRGANGNSQGIGAVVTVRSGRLPVQSREMTSGGYYLSGSAAQLTFAADPDSVATIEVRWRSGMVSRVTTARANRLYEIDEQSAQSAAPVTSPAATPLFANATAQLHGAAHVDSLYADFRRQPLLPSRLSQLGPGVSWIDIDRDGRDDLVFGSGRGGRLTVLRNTATGFVAMPVPGPVQAVDLTMVLPWPQGNGLSLLVGQSNYETASAAEALAVAPVLQWPLPFRAANANAMVPGDTAGVGALAIADVNGDGFLDLFVGTRVIPGAWPLPARSRLWLGSATGALTEDRGNAAALGALGLVASALFTDLDNDGAPELVVASEFGPLRVLHNERGTLRDMTASLGLRERTSRWNGVTAADVDGDGRLDLIATSWGRNIAWHATADRPWEMVVARLADDRLGLIAARTDSVTHREMPQDGLARLGAAIPAIKARFATYADFATADVDAVLGPDARQAVRIGATTFDHTVFLNRGTSFVAQSLPTMAQLAPAFGVVPADFDGDGHLDLFLAQNFFPTEINTMRFDGGAGLLLLGDGRGGWAPQSVAASGLSILGDQRGAAAADYDGDGRMDLAVSQNGAPMTLWHNVRGTPGLRVTLRGPASNPLAIGAHLQLIAGGTRGPVQEIRAGSGYWSMDAATVVLTTRTRPTALWVRWPSGAEQTVPVDASARALTLIAPR